MPIRARRITAALVSAATIIATAAVVAPAAHAAANYNISANCSFPTSGSYIGTVDVGDTITFTTLSADPTYTCSKLNYFASSAGWTSTQLTNTSTNATLPAAPIVITFTSSGAFEFSMVDDSGSAGFGGLVIVNEAVTAPTAPSIDGVETDGSDAWVAFSRPSSDGGASITDYEYSLDSGAWQSAEDDNGNAVTADSADVYLTGLSSGDHSIALRAVNSAGNGTSSSAWDFSITLPPGQPTIDSFTPTSSTSLKATWSAPADSGTGTIVNYNYVLRNNFYQFVTSGITSSGTLEKEFTSLNPGGLYRVYISASNSSDLNGSSAAATYTLPAIAPSAASIDSAQTLDATHVGISFTAPASTGGATISEYEVSTDGGSTWDNALDSDGNAVTSDSSQVVVTSTLGSALAIQVRAVNSAGAGAASSTLTYTPALAPAAPTVTASSEDQGASVTITPGSSNGSAILAWTWGLYDQSSQLLDQGSIDGAQTRFSLDGLTNGEQYYVAVMATNAIGDSAMSDAAGFIPAARPAPAPAPAPLPSQDLPKPTAPTVSENTEPVDSLDPTADPVLAAVRLPAGGSQMLVGGVPTSLTVEPANSVGKKATALRLSGNGFNMTMAGYSNQDQALGLGANQSLILQSQPTSQALYFGRSKMPAKTSKPTAKVSGDGFKASSEVKLYLLPNTYLGSVTTDAAGAFSGVVPVTAGLAAGQYTLQANGYTPDGQVRSVNLGVIVRQANAAVRVREAQARVLFAPMSASLSESARTELKALARKAGVGGQKVVVTGYVQDSGSSHNDQPLSSLRARSVAAYLKKLGVEGTYKVSGSGVASGGPQARRVDVSVKYQK